MVEMSGDQIFFSFLRQVEAPPPGSEIAGSSKLSQIGFIATIRPTAVQCIESSVLVLGCGTGATCVVVLGSV